MRSEHELAQDQKRPALADDVQPEETAADIARILGPFIDELLESTTA